MFKKITIIGGGLIGSSILKAINKKRITKNITIYDKSKKVMSFLKKENSKINVSWDIHEAVRNADLTIMAVPLSAYKIILLNIKNDLKKNSILTDTGSAKKEINKIVKKLNIKDISWIASHPIAGTEDSGPKAGFSELFEKRWCIISPGVNSKKRDVQNIKNVGNILQEIYDKAIEVDEILSLTSHLPHAIAYNIVRTSINNGDKFRQEVIQYSAGGLRDFTRIAASDPLMWRDIFINNSDNIIKVLDTFSDNLKELKKAIKEKNGKKLFKIFSETNRSKKRDY